MPGSSILIIDDDPDVLDALKVLLEDEFEKIATESKTNRIPALLAGEPFDAILLDMNFSAGINTGNEGLYWLSKIIEANPRAVVVMMTAYGNIGLAVEAIKRGAKDFILKPWDNDKLLATVNAAIASSKKQAKSPAINTPVENFLPGASEPMAKLQQQIEKVAGTDASVLILGENGTGKELIAAALHKLSRRAGKPFVAVDMSTLSPGLFESELFGHKKGAFTDAKADRRGRFEDAHGGTLFLDEIGNLPLAQQAKLLTALQRQQFNPVGSNDAVSIDVRLITATNAALPQMATEGLFRTDLLYRINTITLTVPPLRDRGNDILALAQHFLLFFGRKYNKPDLSLSPEAKSSLMAHAWPGNVRELQHTIEKAVILSNASSISSEDLNLSISALPTSKKGLRTLDEMEREALVEALKNHSGNIVQAARALGITRQTLYNKMKRYGL